MGIYLCLLESLREMPIPKSGLVWFCKTFSGIIRTGRQQLPPIKTRQTNAHIKFEFISFNTYVTFL